MMRRNVRNLTMHRTSGSDRTFAMIAKVALGTLGVLAGMMIIRSIPDLIRYVKMERM